MNGITTTRLRRTVAIAFALSLAAGAAAGCGTGGNSTADGSAPLVVYSAQGYDKPMVEAFQKATGIPTKLVDDSTGPLLARIQAERANPQWGVLWVDGDEAFASLDSQKMLVQNIDPQVSYNQLGQALRPKDHSYVPTGVTATEALVYKAGTIAAPPTGWQDLLTPAWKDAVGMPNPSVSGPAYPFVAGMFAQLGGDEQGKQYFQALKNNGLHVYDTNAPLLHGLQIGEVKVALLQSSAGIAAALKDPTLKVAYLPKVTALPSVIGIDAKASAAVQNEAKKFADFVLGRPGQQVMLQGDAGGDSLYWPVVAGIDANSGMPRLDSVPTQTIDPYVWGPKEGEINSWFTKTIAH
ncbi:ABC transporter substrate-binding protein [Nocardia sp. NPDC020380]|uniref:ABC transporter substrate-binding protein n=1 Tax=Nocardia sp. NPDC020380 TaxID=3364309 RepID=UPI00379F7E0F